MWCTETSALTLIYLSCQARVDNVTLVRAACACARAVVPISDGELHEAAVEVLESTERWCDDPSSPLSTEPLWTYWCGGGTGAFAGAAGYARDCAILASESCQDDFYDYLEWAVAAAETVLQRSGTTGISLADTVRMVIRLEEHPELTAE